MLEKTLGESPFSVIHPRMIDRLLPRLRRLMTWTVAMIERYPWAIALAGFASGLASFFLVEREQEKFAQIVSVLMLASWVWLALENLLRRGVASWFGINVPRPVVSFATQMVHQESLFFVTPFFFITTSWNTGQMVFTSLLMLFAGVSIVDPIYYRWLAARRWLYFIFHGVTLFAVLLTALPIILQLPTPTAYLWALLAALVLSLPGVVRGLTLKGWRCALVAVAAVLLAGGVGLYTRPWIPAATLRLTKVAVTDRIDDASRSPENELKEIDENQLRKGLYAYTAIRAPRGLHERIQHVWLLNGREVDRIFLDIDGGREAGYRAWTHKLNFPPYPTGRWEIHVLTEAEQVIGILRFRVVKAATGKEAAPAAPLEGKGGEREDGAEAGVPQVEPAEADTAPEPEGPERRDEPAERDEPVDAEPSMEAEEPTEAEPSMESEEPAESEAAIESKKTAESEASIESEKPVESEKPDESEMPIESNEPAHSEEPAEVEEAVEAEPADAPGVAE